MKNRGDMMGARIRQSHPGVRVDYQQECKKAGIFFRHNYLRHLPKDKATAVLEIGCGLGQFLSFLQAQGYSNASGIDMSRDNVEFCKGQGLKATHADAFEYLDRTESSFGAVVMNDVLEHVQKEKIIPLLEEVFQHLTPGGALILKTINMANPILGAHSRYNDFTHEVGWTEESLREVLPHAGFNTVELYPSDLYVYYRNPLNYVALLLSKVFELLFLAYYRLNGRFTTRIFSKNLIAVAGRLPHAEIEFAIPLDEARRSERYRRG